MGQFDMTWDDVVKANAAKKQGAASAPPSISPTAIAAPQATTVQAPSGISIANAEDAYTKAVKSQVLSAQTPAVSIAGGVQPTIYDNGGLPAHVVQQGIEKMRGQLAKPAAPSSPQAAATIPAQGPTAQTDHTAPVVQTPTGAKPAVAPSEPAGIAARPWYAGSSTTDERSGLEMERARRAEATAAGVMNDPVKSAVKYGVVGADGVATPAPSVQASAVTNTAPASSGNFKQDPFGTTPNPLAIQPNTDAQFITGKNGERPNSSGGGFTDKNLVSYNVNPTSQDGIAKVTATGKNPLYTNINPEQAVATVGNQMIGGDAASVKEGLDRSTRANAIRQQMIDSQPAGGIAVLPDSTEADNAEKTARWRQNDLVEQARNNPAAGQLAIALANGQSHLNAEVARGKNQAAAEQGRNAIAMRGQDITAQSEANRLAGNPADNALKTSKAESEKVMTDLQKKAIAGDQQAIASLRALSGKSYERYKTNVVGGGQNEMGQAQPQYLAVTGPDGQTRFVSPNAGQGAQGGGAPASAIEFLKKNPNQAEAFKAKYGYLPEGF